MSIDKQKIDYYKQKQAGKGSIGLFLDTLFFDIAIFLLTILLLLRTIKLFMLAVIIACAITLLVDFIIRYFKSKKLEKYVVKELTDLRHELLIEKIILRSPKEKRNIVINALKQNNTAYTQTKDPYVFAKNGEKFYIDLIIVLPPKKATVDNIISAVEYMSNKHIVKAVLACTTTFDESALSFAKKTGLDIKFIEQNDLLESAMDLNIVVLDSELKKSLDERIEKERISRKRFLTLATNSKNIKRFSMFGVFLFILAPFTSFRAYYYIASAGCFISAVLIYLYNTNQEGKKDSAEI